MGPASVPWESPSQDWLPFHPLLDNVFNPEKTQGPRFSRSGRVGDLVPLMVFLVEWGLESGWCPPPCSSSHVHSSPSQEVGPSGAQGLSREWQGGGGLLMDRLRAVVGEGREGVAIHVGARSGWGSGSLVCQGADTGQRWHLSWEFSGLMDQWQPLL